MTLAFILASNAFAETTCSYDTYQWNTKEKKAVNYQKVVHPYDQTSDEERDPVTGCTVCIEDQVEVTIPPLKPFFLCKVIAPAVRNTLQDLIRSGQMVTEVVAYRVGKTRGDVDGHGNRTKFSNHSYGVAIDINPTHNGLYDHCIDFGSECRLIRGGPWSPHEQPESIERSGEIVRAFKSMGYLWGGEIKGRQKDFMHFSPTGY